jgi:hypothetical protein
MRRLPLLERRVENRCHNGTQLAYNCLRLPLDFEASGGITMKRALWLIAALFGPMFVEPVYADLFEMTLYEGTSNTVVGSGFFTYTEGSFGQFTVTYDPPLPNSIPNSISALWPTNSPL